jgi:hypothetical protein
MKNSQGDLRRRRARQYHRDARGDTFEQGILRRHDCGDVDPNGLSWWDDVMFILGGVRIHVAWRHPRQVYQGMIVDAAMKATGSPAAWRRISFLPARDVGAESRKSSVHEEEDSSLCSPWNTI